MSNFVLSLFGRVIYIIDVFYKYFIRDVVVDIIIRARKIYWLISEIKTLDFFYNKENIGVEKKVNTKKRYNKKSKKVIYRKKRKNRIIDV